MHPEAAPAGALAASVLARIRVVLIGTTHPGNIGAAARAMKNMGLSRLYLVSPKIYPSAEATARASGAHDVLAAAQEVDSLDQALAGCVLTAGTSARLRAVKWPQLTPRDCAAELLEQAAGGDVALLFGREHSGLSNQELDRCQILVNIPANPEYASLNLSQAVQVLGYELYSRFLTLEGGLIAPQHQAAPAEALEGFFGHLEQAILDIGFADPKQSSRLMRRLRRLFHRARPDQDDINTLRGILSAAQGRKSMRK